MIHSFCWEMKAGLTWVRGPKRAAWLTLCPRRLGDRVSTTLREWNRWSRYRKILMNCEWMRLPRLKLLKLTYGRYSRTKLKWTCHVPPHKITMRPRPPHKLANPKHNWINPLPMTIPLTTLSRSIWLVHSNTTAIGTPKRILRLRGLRGRKLPCFGNPSISIKMEWLIKWRIHLVYKYPWKAS